MARRIPTRLHSVLSAFDGLQLYDGDFDTAGSGLFASVDEALIDGAINRILRVKFSGA